MKKFSEKDAENAFTKRQNKFKRRMQKEFLIKKRISLKNF